MRIDRLNKLADFLDRLPEERFDISRWKSSCGTVACAGGWACTIPEFQEERLQFDEEFLSPSYNGQYAFVALGIFFDISINKAKQLFYFASYPDIYVTPTMVADKIRSLIQQEEGK